MQAEHMVADTGQHSHDDRDRDQSRGHNHPKKCMLITTGSYKKPETYERQKHEHETADSQPYIVG